ncbi:MAG TPA: DUF192 domain-containing protein [Alphaproteobacteria bacterium]|nr:DUF192 domain-containing protein [Alphaproteobacteria bacterium]
MMRFTASLPATAALWLVLAVMTSTRAASLPTAPLAIETSDGKAHHFTVEVANTPEARERGLMYRKSLAADAGMLFDFREPTPIAMWMKNTLIPLDMLFIDDHGRIVRVVERAVPLSLTPIPSGQPVLAVLEVASGTAARLGIKPGDRIESPAFKP